MKLILLSIAILISNISLAQLPDIIQRTMNLQLTEEDFVDREKYMVNVDTLNFGDETLSGEITWFKTKKEMLKKLYEVISVVNHKKIDKYVELKDRPEFVYQKHLIYANIENYRIDWFFSNESPEKLRAITLIKYK